MGLPRARLLVEVGHAQVSDVVGAPVGEGHRAQPAAVLLVLRGGVWGWTRSRE